MRFVLHALDSTDSTQAEVQRLAAHGAPEGTVVTARHQRAGRGQRGREWWDDPGESLLVGLSRAVLRNPSLLIVEEPEQDLEPDETARVNQALAAAAQNRTLILIATRLETLRTADYVYLLHEGRLLADGSHADLLQTSDLYRHLLYLRFNEFRQRNTPQHQMACS